VSKFADHLPLYRQDGIFEREGVEIPRATQTSWIIQTYEAILPLGEVLKQAVVEPDVIFTDDSIIPLQVKGHGRVRKARLWAYVRGDTGPPLTVFDFSHDRSKKRPLDFLGTTGATSMPTPIAATTSSSAGRDHRGRLLGARAEEVRRGGLVPAARGDRDHGQDRPALRVEAEVSEMTLRIGAGCERSVPGRSLPASSQGSRSSKPPPFPPSRSGRRSTTP